MASLSPCVEIGVPPEGVRRSATDIVGAACPRGDRLEDPPSSAEMSERERLEALRRTALLDSPPEEAFDRLTRLAAGVLHAPGALVCLVDEARVFFKSQRGLTGPVSAARETSLQPSFCRHVVATGRPLAVADAREHPIFQGSPIVSELEMIAYAGAPLTTSEGHVLGTICVVDRTPRAWTMDEMDALCAMAHCAVSEIELIRAAGELGALSASLHDLVESRTAQLKASQERQGVLLEVNNAIVRCLDRGSLFDAVARALKDVVPYDRAAMLLFDPEADGFRLLGVAGPVPVPPIIPLGTIWPRHGSRTGWIMDHGEPLLTPDLRESPPFAEIAPLLREGILSALSVPLTVKGKVLGTLNVGSRVVGRYGDAELSLLVAIAEQVSLAIENMLAYEEIAHLKARLEEEKNYLQEEAREEGVFGDVVGASTCLREVLAGVRKVADTDATVLVTGETGTGKELIVRAIHDLSRRREKILVKVNCAALPAGVIESELFGHEKGAFTGALTRTVGRFELADGGTLFLDEVGDLPLELQAKLLRVLQDGEFERVGGTRTLKVRVRLVAATNRDLARAVSEEKFRADLYYRLNVFPLHIPPLRERPDDVPRLVRHFVMLYGERLGKRLAPPSAETMRRLCAYPWPGNVRELQNVIERAVILSSGGHLEVGELATTAVGGDFDGAPGRTLDDVEREHVLSVLAETGWRVSGARGAARILGLKRTTLEARMKRLGIERPS